MYLAINKVIHSFSHSFIHCICQIAKTCAFVPKQLIRQLNDRVRQNLTHPFFFIPQFLWDGLFPASGIHL